MFWLIFLIVLGTVVTGIRVVHLARHLNWPKFSLSLGFGALECVIISAPVLLMNLLGRYFWPVYISSWVLAIALFVKFIFIARKWKFPDGHTSLQADQADRNQQRPR